MRTVGEYTIALRPDSAVILASERMTFLQAFDRVAGESWHVRPDFWASQPSVFDGDRGVALVTRRDEVVGFSIYERLVVDGVRVLYRFATDISRSAQGKGLYSAITEMIIETERHKSGADPGHCAWRTRNPIVWFTNARLCKRVVPALMGGEPDPALIALGRRVAAVLYPDRELEVPSMVMHGAYTEFSLKYVPRHNDPKIDDLFSRHPGLAEPGNALFSIGQLW